ncbi:MAG: carotenoid biosynthesis protein [Candidatus Rokubacteria bacterium]|nr:carotenoid biosynthesis protein [Candidatus Rokubacteria bacterium]
MNILLGTLALRPYVFAFLAAFLVAGVADLGWRRTFRFGAWVWALAWLAEYSSTRTGVPFGLYHYTGTTQGQELYLADVPVMDSLSFTFLAYASFCLARASLDPRRAPRPVVAGLAGALMMLLDVVIDPVAVRGDQWFLGRIFYYPAGGLYFGVPLSNFAGWWLVGALGVGGYLYWSGGRERWGRRPWPGVALYYGVLGFNLVMTAWIGEWPLFAAGLALHGLLGTGLWMVHRAGESTRSSGGVAAAILGGGIGRGVKPPSESK